MLRNLRTIAVNALRPHYLPVMVHKVWLRLKERDHRAGTAVAREWCAQRAEDAATFAGALDAALWQEALAFEATFQPEAEGKLAALGIDLGGGGHAALLYFLVRLRRPDTVLETGVAAGFSSHAILSAIARNGQGMLYSSDFPLFRLQDPEKYVGCLVANELKHRWYLRLNGDRENLEEILHYCGRIGLVHYDSDKSYAGRDFAMKKVSSQLAPDAIVMMDDIQDNFFFRDHVEALGKPFRVFEYGGKYVGLVGL